MLRIYHIFVINPGSTSTKLAFFKNLKSIYVATVPHHDQCLQAFSSIIAQKKLRQQAIDDFIHRYGIQLSDIDAVAARGGLLKPISGGTYRINKAMIQDLENANYGEHASNLAAILASDIALRAKCPAFIVDPVVVDEMDLVAKYSGHPLIMRKSIFHALNQKAVARKAAKKLGKPYTKCRFIVVHLGGGISVSAHANGRVIDVNNALDGDGPFSAERSGDVPIGELINICFSGQYNIKTLRGLFVNNGGLKAYLGTNDLRIIDQRINNGDPEAKIVFNAMVYQICKEIGSMASVLRGRIDSIIITGGMSHNIRLIRKIKKRVSWISKILIYPGELEMSALASGVYRVLVGEENEKVY